MPQSGNTDFSLAGTCAWTSFHPESETGVRPGSSGLILELSDLFLNDFMIPWFGSPLLQQEAHSQFFEI